jgi:hypothetical protein
MFLFYTLGERRGSLMRKALLVFLLAGVFALLAWNRLVSLEVIPAIRGPSFGGPGSALSLRDTVQLTISALLMAASLFVILSKKYGPKEQYWAYGTLGTLVGFWLKAS